MKKLLVFLAVSAGLLLVPAESRAQAKVRIAIWEFENNAEMARWWFYKDMGPAARNQIDTEFSQNAILDSKFSVVERDKLDLVLKEQGLAAGGALDPTTAAKVGKILGVKYIVVGGIDKFNIDNTGGGIRSFGGIGGNVVQSKVTVSMRFVDATTAERVVSISADGEVKKGGGSFRGNSLSRESEWGIASETIQKAAKAVVEKFTTGDYVARVTGAAAPPVVAEGKIIKVDGERAWINLGASSGVKVGDKYTIVSVGEALIDPDSGRKLGADEKQIGSGAVVDVQPEFAIITFTGKASPRDTIRLTK
jgi:curli biogenesis system outer membrane secretion channel CsgG